MAKKIEGHVSLQHADDGFTGDLWMVDSTVTTNAHPRGTLVIHEGKPERVFTESEVRAMLEDVALIVPGNRTTVLARLITDGLKDREQAA